MKIILFGSVVGKKLVQAITTPPAWDNLFEPPACLAAFEPPAWLALYPCALGPCGHGPIYKDGGQSGLGGGGRKVG